MIRHLALLALTDLALLDVVGAVRSWAAHLPAPTCGMKAQAGFRRLKVYRPLKVSPFPRRPQGDIVL